MEHWLEREINAADDTFFNEVLLEQTGQHLGGAQVLREDDPRDDGQLLALVILVAFQKDENLLQIVLKRLLQVLVAPDQLVQHLHFQLKNKIKIV